MTGKFYLMYQGRFVRLGTKQDMLMLQQNWTGDGKETEIHRGSCHGPEVLPDRYQNQARKMMDNRKAKARYSWDTYQEGDPLPRGTL